MKSYLAPYQDHAVLVALSGGLDSVVLLHAVSQAMPRDRIRVIHIHHGLSSFADQWQRHCEMLCASLGVPLITAPVQTRPKPGDSIEAWARDQRYQIFKTYMQADELLLTAQHANDQAETLLLAMVRGSGPKGLSGMPMMKPFGQGYHLRPFLYCPRAELAAYAKAHDLVWVHDESNDNQDYDRNFIRHAVLPVLETRWPSIAQSLTRVAGHCAEQQDLVDLLLEPLWPQIQGSRSGTLSISQVLKQDIRVQKALIRGWLAQLNHPMPGHKMLDEILSTLIPAAEDAQPQVNWGGISVRRYRDDLYALTEDQTRSLQDYSFDWDGLTPLTLPHGAGLLEPAPHLGPCRVRFGQPGLGLKKTFQEQGIPPWERTRIPLIYQDEKLIHIVVYKRA